ncbi:MAG TPA: hypothetical protein VN776_16605 [Terracidiphilus sp.]|nr:hypothetical protein [Terracidiphilus sp.]
MSDFPNSSAGIKQLANDLVKFLRGNIKNTTGRKEWTDQKLDLLKVFFDKNGIDSHSHRNRPEFLWDFVGLKGKDILIAVESEWITKQEAVEYDFKKLLWSKSPLKLMICRIGKEHQTTEKAAKQGEEIRESIERFMESGKNYSPGEIFIIYCVWWAHKDGDNRDIAYTLQVDGKPDHVGIKGKHFQLLPRRR